MNLSTLWSPETSGTKRSGLSIVIVSSKSERGLWAELEKGSEKRQNTSTPMNLSTLWSPEISGTKRSGLSIALESAAASGRNTAAGANEVGRLRL
ncbi:MAG: hypothetical protein QE278_14295 [Limnobacter sp.]|nr:hypothetical protein [Limnobacter sp.]